MRNAADVERICLAALDRPASERAAYLDDACHEDAALRQEVESLLAHASPAEQFFQQPAAERSDALGGLSGLSVGQRLGAYHVIAKLGAGGMGEVYRARDTQLGREVAIKILPVVFAVDPERLARFEREARVLASLNHPHIAAIYGIETGPADAGQRVRALVMELVEGPTLAERIAGGPLSMAEALRIAVQIAEALEAAHDQGVIHRDLKPANIKVRPDGTVKVLDFGLAKLADPADHAARTSVSPTVTSPALVTGRDALLGTAAYMSPEQAKGLPVDKRADVWAFGVVLYEMLTGRRGFNGDTTVEVLSHVLTADPAWSALPPDIPPVVRSLLRRCLQKDPSRRLRDIGDARFQMEESLSEPAGAATVSAPSRAARIRERMLWAGALMVAAGAAWAVREPNRPLDEVRLELNTPPTVEATSLAISPDGKTVAFVASSDGQSRLWLRELATASMRPLPGTDNARLPFWSPDSRSVAFAADGQLKRVDTERGIVQVVASGGGLGGGAWNRDGTILYDRLPGAPLYRVSAEGGNPDIATKISSQANDPFAPQFLPDHRHFFFYATGTEPGIYLGLLGGSDPPRRLLDAQAAAYAASGHLLFVREGTLYSQPFDPVRLQLTGTPMPIAEKIIATAGVAALSTSAAGSIVYRTGPSAAQHQFVWFDRHGTPLEKIAGSDVGTGSTSALSPDARRLAVTRISGTSDIWLLDISRGVPSRFTFDPAFDLAPAWSPDGRQIAFTSNRRGPSQWGLYLKAVDGVKPEEILVEEGNSPTDWSPDGRFVLYEIGRGPLDPQRDVWALPLERPRKPFPVLATRFNETGAQFSPDGKWIAYQSDASGQAEIYVQPFSVPARETQGLPVTNGGGRVARWRRDGKELFYLAPDNRLMCVPIDLNAQTGKVDVGTPVPLFATHLAQQIDG